MSSGLSTGSYNDGWTNDYYSAIAGWIRASQLATTLADEKIESGNVIGRDAEIAYNFKQGLEFGEHT